MSTPLVVLVTLAYLVTAIEQTYRGNFPVGLMFVGYTVGNIGLITLLK